MPAWLLAGSLALLAPAAGPKLELRHLWVYLSTNMLVDRNVAEAEALIARAAKAGYNGLVLTDSKFLRWDDLPARYAANVARVRAACRTHGLDCIAAVCPIGYSEGILGRDPNLAAGLPIVEAPFVVRGGKLLAAEEDAALVNGGFEQWRGGRPAGWAFADEPGKVTFADSAVVYRGKLSLRMQDVGAHGPHGNGRVMQKVKIAPFRQYHVSAAVRTRDFVAAGQVRVLVLGAGGRTLSYLEPRIAATQDWKRIDVTFNSLDSNEVGVYFGVWGGKGGTIWWDDCRLAPAGLVNLIRRDGAPLKVTSSDRETVYVEGRDFADARDRLMGNVSYRGTFSAWHTPPAPTVPPGSRLREGQTVLVSGFHTALIHWGQVCCCMSEPKVYDILDWQIAQVKRHVQPDGYFMQHDEIRVAGWDESCTRRKLTPGQILADNVSRCAAITRKRDAGKPFYVWSDMFDPHHNARKSGPYYLVKGDGPWWGSWERLPAEVIVVNWHGHQPGRLDSLRHFAARGNRQILAGYYDGPPGRIAEWLRDAAEVNGVVGVMYTTWRHNYADLEAFARAAGEATRR